MLRKHAGESSKTMTTPAEATPHELTQAFRARAQALGFVRVGVARAEPLEPEGARLRA